MKKFLALVMALVMAMSLVTISANAAFTDAADIEYKEAVDVMTAVKVVDGYTDGSFNPEGKLTRGAAAKIICNMILGPTTASALATNGAPFKDVPVTNGYAGYIQYCVNEGIISGYSDGTFRPTAPLTGYAFLKMLLGALGYDAATEGYNDANYAVPVAKRAIAIGLTKGLANEFDGRTQVTREEALLYALNTMTATMVEYKNSSSISVGNVTIQTNSVATAVEDDGVNDFSTGGSTVGDATMEFCEMYFKNLKREDGEKHGRQGHTFKLKNVAVSAFQPTDVVLATSNNGTSFANLTDNTKTTYIGYAADSAATYLNGTLQTGGDITTAQGKIGNVGVIAEFIDTDDDGKYETVNVIEKTVYTLIADAATKEVANRDTQVIVPGVASMATYGTTYTVKNVVGYEGLKKGDVVLVYDSDSVRFIEKAEMVTGVATSYDNNTKITVNGTAYNQSGLTNTTYNKSTFVGVATNFKDTYDFYLDNSGAIVKAVKKTTSSDNYVYVLESAWVNIANGPLDATTYAQARVLHMDGTSELVTVTKLGGNKIVGADASAGEVNYSSFAGRFATYTVDANGKYELTLTANVDLGGTAIDGSNATFATNNIGNNATVFLVNTKSAASPKITVYTGIANVPKMTGLTAANSELVVKDGVVKYAYIDAFTAGSTIEGAVGEYVYIPGTGTGYSTLSYTYTPADTTNNIPAYYTVKAIVNGEATTIKLGNLNMMAATDSAYDDAVAVNTVAKVIEKDANGIITKLDAYNASEVGANTGIEVTGGVVKSGSDAKNISETTQFFYIARDGAVTALAADSVVKDTNDKSYILKTSNSAKNAELVYILEVINDVTYTLTMKVDGAVVEYLELSTATWNTKAGSKSALQAAATADKTYEITVTPTTGGVVHVASGALTGTLDKADDMAITFKVVAQDGTTESALQTINLDTKA